MKKKKIPCTLNSHILKVFFFLFFCRPRRYEKGNNFIIFSLKVRAPSMLVVPRRVLFLDVKVLKTLFTGKLYIAIKYLMMAFISVIDILTDIIALI